MLSFILAVVGAIIAQVSSQPQFFTDGGDLMLKIFVPTGTVGGSMSVVWYFIFKQNKNDFAALITQNQTQFQFALTQNQVQFDKALAQIKEQHKENLDEARRTNDKLFEVLKKDTEYKEVLAGVLTELKNDMKQLIQKVK